MRKHTSIGKTFTLIVLGASILYILLWQIVYTTGVNKLAIQSEDTLPAMFLPFTIIKDHTLYLDEYYNQLIIRYPQPDDKDYKKGNTPFYLKKVDNHYLSAFPIITAVISLPVYFLPILLGVIPTWENLIFLSHLSASLITAFSGGILFLLLFNRFKLSYKHSILLTSIYLFATVNFALISQAMWQHGTVQLLILLGLYFFYSFVQFNKPKYLILSGLFFGFAVLARPTALLPFMAIYLLTLIKGTKIIRNMINISFYYLLGLTPSIIFFLFYNNIFYESISNQGYSSQLATSWVASFPVGFLGVWLSPSKGILVYSPIILFSFLGLYLSLKNKESNKSDYICFALVVLIHTLIVSLWKHWYGGWSFGYRMSSDVIPFMVLLIVPFLNSNLYSRYKNIFFMLLIFSVLVQLGGMIFFDGIWHAVYDRGFHNTSWLWSITDSECVFNIRRAFVKFGLLDKACPMCL